MVPAKAPAAATAAPPERREPAIERSAPVVEPSAPVVEPDSERSPKEIAAPSAGYLDAIHARLHPIFAKSLAAFDALPQAPARGGGLVTVLEIVLSPAEGRIEKMGIVKTSGVTMFDVTTLEAVFRAQPLGKAPDIVVSSDGKVYLHWEIHRDSDDACSARNARSFQLHSPR